jgi:VWFA-related protein
VGPIADRILRTSLASAFSAGIVITLAAQSPQGPVFQQRVDVTQFDVTVLDDEGHLVPGLTTADFSATIDGKPARIVDVRPVDVPRPSSRAMAPWVRDVASDVATNDLDAKRMVVIVLDDAKTGATASFSGRTMEPVYSSDPSVGKMGKQIAHAVVDSLGPNDLAAVVYTYLGRGQNFTTDRAKLHRAVESYVPLAGRGGPSLGCVFRGKSGCTMDTLERVIEALPTNPPMRKAIVFISQGEAIRGFSSFESSGSINVEPRDPPTMTAQDVLLLFQQLQRANATIYAFNPAGLEVANNWERDSYLRSFAEVTGGRAVLNTNTPWSAVPAMMDETSRYYLVGLETPMVDGRFHRVKISVAGKEFDVRTRTGFIAPRADGSVGPRPKKDAAVPTPIDAAMSQGVPQAGLPLRAALMTRRIPGSRDSEARIVVGVPGETGAREPYAVSLESAAFQAPTYNEKQRHEQQLRIDPAQGGVSEARATFRLSPGRYELRVAGEAGERTGSVFLDVDLDTKAPLVLSSPGLTLSGASADTAPLTVQRVFRAADRPRLLAQVVRRDRRAVERAGVNLSITDTDGRVVMARELELGVQAFNRDGIADLDLELPLRSLETGEYLAAVTVSSGKDEAVATLRFERR